MRDKIPIEEISIAENSIYLPKTITRPVQARYKKTNTVVAKLFFAARHKNKIYSSLIPPPLAVPPVSLSSFATPVFSRWLISEHNRPAISFRKQNRTPNERKTTERRNYRDCLMTDETIKPKVTVELNAIARRFEFLIICLVTKIACYVIAD